MKAADWSQLRTHFESLCDLPTARREQALQQLDLPADSMAQLRSMLAADDADRLAEGITQLAPQLLRAAATEDPDHLLGQRLGAWRVLDVIGSGGMGHVYRVRRDDGRFDSEAALKIVASRLDAARFLQERAVLARLQHPHIAGLLDGGECEDGRPYLVMEYVRGEQIDQWCARQLPGLATRLAQVLAAARAVAYAHARAVLHRDLKPANILIDAEQRVKLLDFGIAKLLDQGDADPALTSARYYTPRYAAPEQLACEIATTATDVFSLAVVLYELLTGRHPFAATNADSPARLSRRMLTEQALPLRRALPAMDVRERLPGGGLRDLEAVLARALQADPRQRYSSMDAFAEELQRVLDDRPVQTRPVGLLERPWRWARRHRLAAVLATLGLLSLLLGSGVAWWQALEAGRQRDAALLEAARAERVGSFLADIFRAANPAQSQGAEVSARELLDRGRQRIASELGDDPLLRERLQRVIADTYRSLGLYEESEALLQEALAVATDPARRGELLSDLGWLHAFQGRYEDSAEQLQAAVALLQASAQENRQVTDLPLRDAHIVALQRLATPLINLARFDEAEAAAGQALALDQALPQPDLKRQSSLQALLGSVAFSRGDHAAARASYRAALDTQRRLYGPGHTAVGLQLGNLGTVAFREGKLEEAIDRYREAIALQRAYFGVDNTQVAAPLANLGLAQRRLGQGEAALTSLREAAAIHAAWSGASHRFTLQVRLDALELALLQQVDAGTELTALAAAANALDADPLWRCRWAYLQAQAAAVADPPRLAQAYDCLQQQAAPAAVLAHAALGLARLQPSPQRIAEARQHADALQPPDALLVAALARLRANDTGS